MGGMLNTRKVAKIVTFFRVAILCASTPTCQYHNVARVARTLYSCSQLCFTVLCLRILIPSLPRRRRHHRSSPGCPILPLDLPEQSGTGSGTAGSLALDRRSSSVSCHSVTSAQSGTRAFHSAARAKIILHVNVIKCITQHRQIAASVLVYL